MMDLLSDADPQISQAIECENRRQQETINLIASENHASLAVMAAQGTVLTDKYAEGYPGNRYYGGCDNVDTVESIAIQRAQELFKAEHANVQSHSGAQANMAAYHSLLKYGDTVLSMSLAHGGHLTHGDKASFSGRLYNFIHYGVDRETERIDYSQVERLAKEHRPKLIVAGASSYPRVIDFERFRSIADMVGAKLMVDMAHIAGLVAAGLHPTPVPYAEVITATTHKTLRGPRGGFIMCRKELGAAIDHAVFPETQGGPLMHVIAAKAVCFGEALKPAFHHYATAVLDNARALASELQTDGLRLVSGGTDNHMVLVDLTSTGVTGLEAQTSLQKVGIVANRNAIPFDPRPPRVASGIRLGTPAVSTRGFGTAEIRQVARIILRVIKDRENPEVLAKAKAETSELCKRFPLTGG
jgi:glycine hydroxymethyltransferase